MDKMERLNALTRQLNTYNYYYYTLDDPQISDAEYDRLYDELVRLEKELGMVLPDSPTRKVGGEVLPHFSPHRHLNPLWSLDKAQTMADLDDWHQRTLRLIQAYNQEHPDAGLPQPEFTLEQKYDGLTIVLTYEDGVLTKAASRGNGVVGEMIYGTVKVIPSIPLAIEAKGVLEIQGEAIMPLSALSAYNETHDEKLKNARNGVAGALRNLNNDRVRERKIDAFFYHVNYTSGEPFDSQEAMMQFLREQRLKVNPYFKKFSNLSDLKEEIEAFSQHRHGLDYEIDGLVIKINQTVIREALGYTAKFPRWAVAWKFEASEEETRLVDVVWNVGRTGKLTPLARLEPVEIGGVTVSNATLNNMDDIRRKGLTHAVGMMIRIRRSNDVIPEILGLADPDSPEQGREVVLPDVCPSCGGELEQRGAHLFCINALSCRPQLVGRLKHFASRDAMDIEGFSEKTAEQLIEAGYLRDIADIYRLRYEDLIHLERFAAKKAGNLLDAIENSKTRALDRFI
jgi:DNA ligase (NAD+)